MTKHLLKTFVAFVAIAAMAIGPVRGQNGNVSWVLTPYGDLQTGDTVVIVDKTSARALPKPASSSSAPGTISVTLNSAKDTLTSTPGATLKWVVVRDGDNYKFRKPGTDNEYLYFTGGDNGVRVGNNENNQFSFENGGTYNVPFLKNNATTRYFGLTNTNLWRSLSDNSTSTIKNTVIGFYKKTVIPTHTVRMAAGTEEAANWSIASGNVSVDGTQVLENVMSGSQVTATYSGTRKVKSVKAVKYVAPPTLLDNTTTAWADGKYAVPAGGLTYSDAITVSGDVTLVLTDGETLTLNKGISLASGATLTIQGNGTMNVNGTNESTASTVAGTGTLVLTSGTLTATGGNGGSVDVVETDAHGGNGGDAINGSVIVSGGTLTARGGNGGSVDFQCSNCSGGNGGVAINGSVIVNSGTLTATGGNGGSVGDYGYSCGGGAGSAAISGDLTINRGTETLTNGANGQLGQNNDECSAGAGGQAVAGTVTDNR